MAALALGLAGLASGCAIEATPALYAEVGDPYYPVEAVPGDLDLYPHVYYRGSYAYWVGGRWIYPGPRGWVSFRSEPAELYRYRVNYGVWPHYGVSPRYRAPYYGSPVPVYRAPPARYPTYRAPPAYRARPPAYQAPRARPPTYQAPPARRGR
jgi:hypothetical protein